jgi:hypothetical protein
MHMRLYTLKLPSPPWVALLGWRLVLAQVLAVPLGSSLDVHMLQLARAATTTCTTYRISEAAK